jgi:CBS domain-containing protein
MLKVKDIMRRRITALTPEMGLKEAVDKITEAGVLGLPVVDEQGELQGFVSEQDCLTRLLTESYHCDSHITVADIMRTNPLHLSEDLTVFSAAQLMGSGKPKVFPITREGKLVGILTRGHVVQALAESLEACKAF